VETGERDRANGLRKKGKRIPVWYAGEEVRFDQFKVRKSFWIEYEGDLSRLPVEASPK